MPMFQFTARDGSGTLSTGSVMADSITAAVDALRSDGKYPTSLTPAEQTAAPRTALFSRDPKMGRKDILQFATQLQIMIETGVTLSEELENIGNQAHKPAVKAVVGDLCRS